MGNQPTTAQQQSNPSQESSKPKTISLEKKEEPKKYQVQKKIGIGLIGIGARLSSLLVLLLRMHPELVEVKAISDESPEAIGLAQEDFNFGEIPVFLDYKELLKQEGIDWILIGSKNYQHHDHCIAAFNAKKHVFCEKPLAISIEQCENIRNAWKNSGQLFATGFVLRHAPMYQKVKEIVMAGELGEIISIEANELLTPGHGGYIMRNWRRFVDQSGPHILEKCCHDLDIITWIVGSVPTRVAAFGGTSIFVEKNQPKSAEQLKLYTWWPQAWENVNPFTVEKTIEDNVVAILEYRNNVRVTFHTNCNSWGQRRLQICGIKGTLKANLVTSKLKWERIDSVKEEINRLQFGRSFHGGGDIMIIEDLCECMFSNNAPKASGEEGFVSAIICLSIDEARRTGKVVDMEPYWSKFNI